MRILLLGYGKMGKTIEKIALERGHSIVGKIDIDNRSEMDALQPADVDVAIEFSAPEAAYHNITYCLKKGWPVVSGTTGWLEHRAEIEKLCVQQNGAFFYASNYSIGVNLFFRLNRQLARLMNGHGYEQYMTEIHHIHKLDAPSGTAITLAEAITDEIDNLEGWKLAPETESGYLQITSKREGEVPGTHIVRYESEVDTIEISHTAHSRAGFALGAVVSAEWLPGRNGVFGMNDLLKI
ncbi:MULTISPECIES: 4-hydroxy-tetrahydrodipicolinate reductase [Dyadobacter]|uniref:4-hydroxy-tetrahydrodipicolinate reductase n=1 Tax=Dyadobacter chenhuakuii TaxID=2909339 RepID=A0A9X1QAS5_9BACT|nr:MULTISPECIES: 4-hydroxy-tetrahydrodipicolinate reductase [Dyadobacter]MCE7070310.1 4-hydroxy-tetrahydrodipicolinate reductase [Dyadobacter sp. CY327]MCF2492609.1 4-hydroxy-tetrahydrodipicolinate reductase [Dyadobacter chenhuakuii]MCF2496983.1 4-hydroxy-tetrahydrodipicolinate reductase [Dyadobacter chenhuakuii]MCF2520374.1 4-hydroxy-tetrahydrodipicolinate reductase [Dyadobacter sp. CY351]USJ33097.1 4-hydroxy-tetrahydrodipicolinate reductase [Dyadobacter chenhuakuii]